MISRRLIITAIEFPRLPTIGDIVRELLDIVGKRTQKAGAKLSAASTMEDAGVDSFAFVEMIFDVEDHFGIELDVNANQADATAGTIGDVANMILSSLRARRES